MLYTFLESMSSVKIRMLSAISLKYKQIKKKLFLVPPPHIRPYRLSTRAGALNIVRVHLCVTRSHIVLISLLFNHLFKKKKLLVSKATHKESGANMLYISHSLCTHRVVTESPYITTASHYMCCRPPTFYPFLRQTSLIDLHRQPAGMYRRRRSCSCRRRRHRNSSCHSFL